MSDDDRGVSARQPVLESYPEKRLPARSEAALQRRRPLGGGQTRVWMPDEPAKTSLVLGGEKEMRDAGRGIGNNDPAVCVGF